MLILSRRQGQSVTLIDTTSKEKINITVKKIKRGSIHLAFDASDNVKIKRDELLETEQ